MTHALAEAARSISNAAGASSLHRIENKERGDKMVELDQFKTLMNAYEEPLAEMRDSL